MSVDPLEEVGSVLTVDPRLSTPVRAEILQIIERNGGLLQGHFALQSKKHSPYFLRFAHIGRDRAGCERVARLLLDLARLKGSATVLCPESAGFFLGDAVARSLPGSDLATTAIDSRRCPLPALRTGRLVANRNVIIANDVVTTGASLVPMLDLVAERRARVAAILVFGTLDVQGFNKFLADRKVQGAWLVSAHQWPIVAPAQCTQCARGAEALEASEFN